MIRLAEYAYTPHAGVESLDMTIAKPPKPTPDFPLYSHRTGRWAKKIGGKTIYFGRWEEPDKALAEYKAFLLSRSENRHVVGKQVGLTIRDACDSFLSAKQDSLEQGELTRITFDEYKRSCLRVADHFGRDSVVEHISPADFQEYRAKIAENWGIIAVGNEITRVRSLFRWCHDQRLIKERPFYGSEFKKPSAKALRRHRRLSGKKLYTPEEIKRLLDFAGTQMRAMILMGINGGLGNTDLATVTLGALEGTILNYPRPKTEVDRLIPLWPETLAAIEQVKYRHYVGKLESDTRLFVLPDGQFWDNSSNPIAKHFRQVRLWAGLKRGGFYWLRHTFRTVADGARDQVAAGSIMGHVEQGMAANYRQEIDPARLLAVTNHVRTWLFG